MIRITLLFVALLSGCSTWHPPEQRMFALSAACHAVDLMQTDAAIESGKFVEGNPLLSERPDDNELIAVKTAALVATWWVGETFPDHRWQAIAIATVPCIIAVGHNYSEGARP